MSTDIEAEIAIIKKTVEENNKILKNLQSKARWSSVLGWAKWIVYILILIGAYSALKPFIDQMLNTYSAIQDGADSLSQIKASTGGFDINSLKDLFK